MENLPGNEGTRGRAFLKGACRHCRGHLEFPADALGETSACPHCGETTTLTVRSSRPTGRQTIVVLTACLFAGLVPAWLAFRHYRHKPMLDTPFPHPALAAPAAPPKPKNPPPTPPPAPSPAPAEPEEVVQQFGVSHLRLEHETGSTLAYVTGRVRNLTDHPRYGVKLQLKVFDRNDQFLGRDSDYQAVLDPHGTWKFKALVVQAGASSAVLDEIIEQ